MVGFTLPFYLARASQFNTRANRGSAIAQAFTLQLALSQRPDRHVHIDAIKQRPGNFIAIALDLIRRAPASIRIASVIATGTWVHRGNKLEAGRKTRLIPRA